MYLLFLWKLKLNCFCLSYKLCIFLFMYPIKQTKSNKLIKSFEFEKKRASTSEVVFKCWISLNRWHCYNRYRNNKDIRSHYRYFISYARLLDMSCFHLSILTDCPMSYNYEIVLFISRCAKCVSKRRIPPSCLLF